MPLGIVVMLVEMEIMAVVTRVVTLVTSAVGYDKHNDDSEERVTLE